MTWESKVFRYNILESPRGRPRVLRLWSLCMGEFCLKQRLPDSHPGFSTLSCSSPALNVCLEFAMEIKQNSLLKIYHMEIGPVGL